MTKYRILILSGALILTPALVMAEDSAVVTDTVIDQAEAVATELTAPVTVPGADTAADQLMQAAPSLPSEVPMPSIAPETVAVPTEPSTTVIAPEAVVEAPAVITEAIPTDNLEFISGEISSADETTQSVTVKLYGETESGTSDKTLKVTIDGTTDITDGEQDRDLKSLTAGTEVDVEYDPATNKATYIFVY